MKKMYYAEYCEYGVNISYESFGGRGNAFTFYAFDSKKKRDEWVCDSELEEENASIRLALEELEESIKDVRKELK